MDKKREWDTLRAALSDGPKAVAGVRLELASSGHRSGGFFTLCACPRPAVFLFSGGRRVEAPAGSALLLRCGGGWRLEGEAAVELRFPSNFFDRLLFSQLADCRMLYEFLSLPAPEEEFLCYDYPLNSPPNDALLWLCEEFLHPDQHSEKLLHCMMTQALTLLHRDFRAHLAVSRSTMIRGHEFGKVLKYIGDHYDTVTLTSLAQEFNYNPSYLSTLFRQVTGETFREKLFHIRMEQGLWALEHTDQSVQQISRSLGFKEKSYFLRQFKARYGATPSRYRKTLRERSAT